MTKSKDIGILKLLYLYYLTGEQEKALSNLDHKSYMEFTAKHFKAYFGLDIIDMVIYAPDSPEAKALLHRHSCMVISNCFPNASARLKKTLYKAAQGVLRKDLMLGEEV